MWPVTGCFPDLRTTVWNGGVGREAEGRLKLADSRMTALDQKCIGAAVRQPRALKGRLSCERGNF